MVQYTRVHGPLQTSHSLSGVRLRDIYDWVWRGIMRGNFWIRAQESRTKGSFHGGAPFAHPPISPTVATPTSIVDPRRWGSFSAKPPPRSKAATLYMIRTRLAYRFEVRYLGGPNVTIPSHKGQLGYTVPRSWSPDTASQPSVNGSKQRL
jgi:hypothetical protein